MNDSTTGRTMPAIKGSWEDLLAQGQQMAANMNDEAIPILRKVYSGLLRLPKKQRMGGNSRLQNVFIQAAVGLHGYLNMRDQYNESLEIVANLMEITIADEDDPQEVEFWEDRYIHTLELAGRTEEAIEKRLVIAESDDGDLGDWGGIVMAYLDEKDYTAAESILERMQAILNTPPKTSTEFEPEAGTESPAADADESDEESSPSEEDQAYLEGLRAIVALDSGKWEDGIVHFEQAIILGDIYANNLQFLYARLATHGQLDEAMRYIERDKNYPIRRGFWRGLILHKQGRQDDAERAWRAVIKTQPSETERTHFLEYILSSYYLDDPDGEGLSTVLQTLRESDRPAWAFFMLAGIGWAVRDDLTTARNNLNIALMQYKANAYGRKLPESNWRMIEDLFDSETAAQLTEYFDLPGSSSTTSESPSSAAADSTIEAMGDEDTNDEETNDADIEVDSSEESVGA